MWISWIRQRRFLRAQSQDVSRRVSALSQGIFSSISWRWKVKFRLAKIGSLSKENCPAQKTSDFGPVSLMFSNPMAVRSKSHPEVDSFSFHSGILKKVVYCFHQWIGSVINISDSMFMTWRFDSSYSLLLKPEMEQIVCSKRIKYYSLG